MSTTLPAATAFCMAGRTSRYDPFVMTNGSSVVTPPVTACRLSVTQSDSNDWAALPRCTCVSMSPGSTWRPSASSVRRASTVSPGPTTAATRPSRIARPHSTTASGLTTRQPVRNRPAFTPLRRRPEDLAVGVRATELEEAPELPHVVARPGIDVGVQDFVLLVAGPADHVALRVDEERGAEVLARRAADVLADLVHAADVIHVGDGVAAQLHLPHLADPVAVGRRRHQDEMRALEAEDPRRLGEVTVVADQDADAEAERRVEDREAEVARREEEALVGRRLARLHRPQDLGDAHLAVPAQQAAVGAEHGRRVVERAVVVLVERVHDHGARLARDTGQPVDGGAGYGLRGLEPLAVTAEAEVDRRAELGEADDLGAVAGGLPRQILRLLDVDLFRFVTAELGERDADHVGAPPERWPPL